MIRCLHLFVVSLFVLFIGFVQAQQTPVLPKQANKNTPQASDNSSAQKTEECDTSLIAQLNGGIQIRFSRPDKDWGMSRVARQRTQYHLHNRQQYNSFRFVPETLQEKLAIEELETVKLKVGFYLVGRSILADNKPDQALWDDPKNEYFARKPINNPLLMTSQTNWQELPSAWVLWDEAQKAMQLLQDKNQYDFRFGEWNIAARPIRASEAACLQCHLGNEKLSLRGKAVIALPDDLTAAAKAEQQNETPAKSKLKIGDPLGVAMYVYK